MVRNNMPLRTYYSLYKRNLAEKVATAINKKTPDTINNLMINLKIGTGVTEDSIGFRMSLDVLKKQSSENKTSLLTSITSDKSLHDTAINSNTLVIHLNKYEFLQNVLQNDVVKKVDPSELLNKKPYIIEFSSPNIAKPFHVGHFRSTIIGNFLSRLMEYMDGRVIKLNYLGDWGPQFGYIILGLELLKKQDPHCCFTIESLHKAYILANKMAEKDDSVHVKAKSIFNELEFSKSSSDIIQLWTNFRSITIEELEKTYKRLGVIFDWYDWESKYAKESIQDILEKLEHLGILKYKDDGSAIVYCNNQETTVLKNDKSTLYLTRDIAAAVRRHEHYNSENLFYIVDSTQSKHFYQLKSIMHKIDPKINVQHIPFGRIHGMRSRKGEGVLLDELLNEAKSIMTLRRKFSQTTKLNDQDENEISDILGVSAIIINDLKQKRKKDYNFSWESALQVNGDTGIKLQYTHCRLVSLIQMNSNIEIPNEVNIQCLKDPVAIELVLELCRFEDILAETRQSLEACILVNYLFRLCNSINRALKVLNVKNSVTPLAEQRLLLFNRAKNVLSIGMTILGLIPLKSM
ncbi:probable arginine--tRNA ligase, mitochondrial [Adelges cooleyi]|uniref:probable arginine--tRNA ligase, mitochondrial n=1 Tax=Adelges cooleyi TaxID=133065 RepID=UPI0021804A05|nr:probable arginine--tRNA ligase, mitochondrial [Adelges cooleyi]